MYTYETLPDALRDFDNSDISPNLAFDTPPLIPKTDPLSDEYCFYDRNDGKPHCPEPNPWPDGVVAAWEIQPNHFRVLHGWGGPFNGPYVELLFSPQRMLFCSDRAYPLDWFLTCCTDQLF